MWDWELMNDNKPIWTRKPSEVADDEYTSFYRTLTKDTSPPLAKSVPLAVPSHVLSRWSAANRVRVAGRTSWPRAR